MYSAEALRRRSDPEETLQDGDEHRSRFAQDRDRLLYSSAFRRLAGKSQVVASIELGSFHTRLTHSLKVAQLGRRLTEQLQLQQTGDHPGPDPDLVEFACLAHDLGHPPFGHAGETQLHKSIEKKLEFSPSGETQEAEKVISDRLELGGFEGNPQSLRLISRLAHKWLPSDGEGTGLPPDWYGLDLTAASLDAATKYPWERTSGSLKKWGAYGRCETSDTATLRWAREHTGAEPVLGLDASKSFEAQLMDWCDDVTYAVHDVEDFYQVGFIPLELLFATEPTDVWEDFRDWLAAKWQGEDKQVSADTLDEVRTNLVDYTFTALAPRSFTGSNTEKRLAHKRTSSLIRRFVGAITFDGEPCLHRGEFLIDEDSERRVQLQMECDVLKELIWRYVIDSPSLATQQEGHRRIIRDLVDIYCDSPELLPTHLQEMLNAHEVAVGYGDERLAKLRVVADHVSSLTEQHAISLHRRLTGADPGGFRDLI